MLRKALAGLVSAAILGLHSPLAHAGKIERISGVSGSRIISLRGAQLAPLTSGSPLSLVPDSKASGEAVVVPLALEGPSEKPISTQAEAPAAAPAQLSKPQAEAAQPAAGVLERLAAKVRKEWNAGLLFDKSRELNEAEAAKLSQDPASVHLLIVRHGKEPVATTLARLPAAMQAHGLDAKDFNGAGHLRLVLAERKNDEPAGKKKTKIVGLQESDAAPLAAALVKNGLTPNVLRMRAERVMLDHEPPTKVEEGKAAPAWQTAARVAVALAVAAWYLFDAFNGKAFSPLTLAAAIVTGAIVGSIASNFDRLLKEVPYVFRTYKSAKAESKDPSSWEKGWALFLKSFPFFAGFGVVLSMYAGVWWAIPVAIALSLALDTFHAVRADAWNTLNAKLYAQRGAVYQALFGFLYGQVWGVVFRTIGVLAIGAAGFWSAEYWLPTIAMTIVGSFFGAMGWVALTSLYEKGRVNRMGRITIQGVREIFFMAAGAFMGTGHLWLTAVAFGLQQAFDLAIYLADKKTGTRTVIYASDASLAGTKEYANAYPAKLNPLAAAIGSMKHLYGVFSSLLSRLNPKAKP